MFSCRIVPCVLSLRQHCLLLERETVRRSLTRAELLIIHGGTLDPV
jgi:hypothetical protein